MKGNLIDIAQFINEQITGRSQSMFVSDLENSASLLARKIDGKNVLVIGGAGTIGASYIKAILKFKVKKLLVVDINENALTELMRDIRSSNGLHMPADIKTYPVNFGDPVFKKILQAEGPFQIVANFAAHKHVRSEKDIYSIEAMIDNNVLKARKLLDTLKAAPPEHFFCVSTDKAANPVNIMGASKKLMEDTIINYADEMHITTARFANVAFSNGSLPIGFIERLMKKQPLSSPSNVKRYFVSPQESGELCLMACMLGQSGDIFFPKLNEGMMMTFSEIALRLLHTMGLEADICSSEEEAREKSAALSPNATRYPVYFFESDTTGEKLYEEFYTSDELIDMDRFKELGVIRYTGARNKASVNKLLDDLTQTLAGEHVTKAKIVDMLKTYLGNFDHVEKGFNLDQRM